MAGVNFCFVPEASLAAILPAIPNPRPNAYIGRVLTTGSGPIDTQGLERGMRENRPALGAGPQEGTTPFKVLRRQAGRFSPYRFGARRISGLKASKMLDSGEHRLALFSCSGPKSAPRLARNLNVDWS
jgi:hypothetical protein